MKIFRHFLGLLLLVGACGYLLYSSYSEVKKITIDNFNKNQLTYAKQASESIQDFFEHYSEVLSHLVKINNVIDINAPGKELLQNFFTAHAQDLAAVSRIDAQGKIVYTYPEVPNIVGTDISKQEHIKHLLKTHQPTISDVFTSVLGYRAIAIHYPVFKDKVFQGSLGFLIPFENLARNFLENIKIGEDGYAWMMTQKGVEIYCPVPGHVGNSVFENCKDFPTILAMAEKMTRGEQGETIYIYDRIRDEAVESIKKHAVFFPIKLGNTFWSIVVATPEKEILAAMSGFKNSWIIFITILMVLAIAWSFYSVRNIFRSEEEIKRKKIEAELEQTEAKYSLLYATMSEGVCLHELVYDASGRPKDYKILDINPAYTKITGLSQEQVIGKLAIEVYGTTEAPYLDIYSDIAIKGKSTTFETYFPPMRKYLIISAIALTEGKFATIFFDITDRKQAEEALKKSEGLYRLVFANVPIGIMHYDKDGTITDLNDKFADIIGAPIEKIIGFNMVHQLQDKQMLQAVQTALNGAVGYYEGDYLSVSAGKITPSRAIYNPIFSEQGEVVGGVSIFEDITERKQAEESLRESDARWKFALEGPGDGVWDWTIPTNKVFFSHQWKAMLGYTDEEIGDGLEEWDKRVHPDDKQGCYADLEKHFKGEAPFYQNEHRLLCKDGTYKWILDRGKVMQWADDGKPLRVIGIHTDITERKNVDQAFKTLMESTIASVGQEYFDLVVNKLCEWLQCEVAMVGELVDNGKVNLLSMQVDGKLIYGQYYLLENTPCEDVYNKGFCSYPQRVQELFPLSQDLKDLQAEGYVGTPLRDRNNQVVGILCALSRDSLTISPHTKEVMHLMAVKTAAEIERLKLEQERATIEAQLRQAQKMEGIGTLAGGIAHDFNNILMAILGYTEMSLMETPTQSKSKQYLEQVRKASYRAKELVDQILTFSRKQEGARTPLEISLVIKEALKLLRASLPTTIEIKQLINSKGNVMGDPTQVHQILMNLCTNAFHAMPQGGLLEISLEDVEISSQDIIDLAPGPYVRLQIKDAGEGIDPSIQERIFEPYFTTKEVGKGSGMGLAVVMGIVKSHGGAITVNSELGQGSTFTIYIPRTEVEIVQPREEQSTDVGHETGRILFVDDEVTIADFIKAALEMMGYEVVVSTNSVAALELFRAQPDRFDLVITDLTMPKLTGVDLAQQLSRIKPGIPVILCTGYKDKFTKDDVKNMGVSDIIIKPIGIKDLGAAVQKVLREIQDTKK